METVFEQIGPNLFFFLFFFFFSGEDVKEIILSREVGKIEKDADSEGENNKEKMNEEQEEEKDKEILLIQDTGFSVFIAAPGLDLFELPVSLFDQLVGGEE